RGVVRRADDRAGRELLGLREVRQARRRDVPDEAHVDADGAEARREGALEHPAAAARVSPDDDRVPRTAEHVPGRTAEAQRELRRELAICDAPDAVGPE